MRKEDFDTEGQPIRFTNFDYLGNPYSAYLLSRLRAPGSPPPTHVVEALQNSNSPLFRLNRGGDRQANAALYRIVLTRMSSHEETRRYVAKRRTDGLSTPEIMRCLKRYVARQTFKHLPHMT